MRQSYFTRPFALHDDAVQIQIRMITLDRTVTPGLDLGIDILVQIGNRTGRYPCAPKRLGDIRNPAHRNTRQIHLHKRFFNRTFAPPVTLDDRRLKRLPAQLGNLQLDLTGLGVQRSLITARPRVIPALTAFITTSSAKLISFHVQQRIQGLFNRPANHLAEIIPDTGIVNLDHLTHVFALPVVTHHIAPSKITERNRQIQKCERFFTLTISRC